MTTWAVDAIEAETQVFASHGDAVEFARGWAKLGYKRVVVRRSDAVCRACGTGLFADFSCPSCDY